MNRPPLIVLRHPSRFWLGGILLVPLLGIACDGEAKNRGTVPVEGQILLGDKPVSGATVVFHPVTAQADTPRSYARTDADGKFSLSTYKVGDGAPPGDYLVTVMMSSDDDRPSSLPQRYASPEASGLRAEVKEGASPLPPFRLASR